LPPILTYWQKFREMDEIKNVESEILENGKSENDTSEIEKSNIGKSEIGKSENGKSESGQFEIGKSKIGKSENRKSEIGNSENRQSEIGKSETAKLETPKSEIGKSEIGKSESEKCLDVNGNFTIEKYKLENGKSKTENQEIENGESEEYEDRNFITEIKIAENGSKLEKSEIGKCDKSIIFESENSEMQENISEETLEIGKIETEAGNVEIGEPSVTIETSESGIVILDSENMESENSENMESENSEISNFENSEIGIREKDFDEKEYDNSIMDFDVVKDAVF